MMAKDEYGTAVIFFPNGEGRAEFFSFIHERFPMLADNGPRATMLGEGDCVSIAQAAEMALESTWLGQGERIELAQELLAANNREDCSRIFTRWQVEPDGKGALRDTEGAAA